MSHPVEEQYLLGSLRVWSTAKARNLAKALRLM
jgi:hypothetical protein